MDQMPNKDYKTHLVRAKLLKSLDHSVGHKIRVNLYNEFDRTTHQNVKQV